MGSKSNFNEHSTEVTSITKTNQSIKNIWHVFPSILRIIMEEYYEDIYNPRSGQCKNCDYEESIEDAIEDVAEILEDEDRTAPNEYLIPETVSKYIKLVISMT